MLTRQRHPPHNRRPRNRRPRRRVAFTLVATLLGLAPGCTRFPLPFVDRDATADARPTHDAPSLVDTTATHNDVTISPDTTGTHDDAAIRMDTTGTHDGGAVSPDTTGTADVLPPDGPSCTPPTWDPPVSPCGQPCNQTGPDQDCDGLPDVRDPLPSSCQPGLLAEDFAKDPTHNAARWTTATPANITWTCGQANLAADTTVTLADPNLLKSSTTGPYLVETRFTLGQATDPANWSVGIHVGLTTGAKFTCTAWMSSAIGPTTEPASRLGIDGCNLHSNLYTKPIGPGTGAVGESYILQFWYDTTAHCRLLFDDKGSLKLQSESSNFTCAVTRPDTFAVATQKRAVTLHTIRVFAFPN